MYRDDTNFAKQTFPLDLLVVCTGVWACVLGGIVAITWAGLKAAMLGFGHLDFPRAVALPLPVLAAVMLLLLLYILNASRRTAFWGAAVVGLIVVGMAALLFAGYILPQTTDQAFYPRMHWLSNFIYVHQSTYIKAGTYLCGFLGAGLALYGALERKYGAHCSVRRLISLPLFTGAGIGALATILLPAWHVVAALVIGPVLSSVCIRRCLRHLQAQSD